MLAKLLSIRSFLLFMFTFFSLSLFAQTTKVSGKVTGPDQKPLAGATVTVKGTTVSTATSADGSFVIDVPKGHNTLTITSIGYETIDKSLSGDNANFVVSMKSQTTTLNEIVLTGYTSQRRKDITGAVAIVPVNEMKAQPSFDAANQLQGKASGVTVTASGVPGTAAAVRIRGLGSFNNNQPLYVIDGVQTFDISGLNPDDIETMQILKDAASASIYGVRGSNGVIVVTTKQAKKRGVNVTYSGYYGTQNPGKGFDLLNAQEAAQLYFLQRKNAGVSTAGSVYGNGTDPVLPDYIYYTGYNQGSGIPIMNGDPGVNPALYDVNYNKLGDDNYTPYIIVPANKNGTDWYAAITRNAPITNQNVTLAGQGENSKYLLSANYFNQQAITNYQFYRRFSVRMNSEFNAYKNIRIGENLQMFYSTQNTPGNGNSNNNGTDQNDNTESSTISQAFRLTSIVPVYTIKPGDFAGNRGGPGVGTWGNSKSPAAQLYRQQDNRNNNVNVFGNVYGEVDILKHFTFRSSFGGYTNFQNVYNYPTIQYENNENTANTTYNNNTINNNYWIFTNTLTYKNDFGKNNLTVLIGTEAQKNTGSQTIGASTGFFNYNNRAFINLGNGSTQNLSGSQTFTATSLVSYFAQANYSYDNKYLLTALVRRDGSSKFVDPNQFATFPAFSVGWRISEENFMKGATWINELKLRGSWGKLGNESAAPALNYYTQFAADRKSSFYDINGTQSNPADGFYLSFLGNKLGQWEESTTANYGFDFTFLNNSTTVIFDYYTRNTDKLLYNPSGQGILGGVASNKPPYSNVGSMENHGIDISVTNRASITKDFKLTTTATFTTYTNKITQIGNGISFFEAGSSVQEQNRIGFPATRNIIGNPLGTYFGYKVIGLFQSADEVAKSPTQTEAAPGRFKYADVNGDGKITPDDRTIIGNPNPKFTYGINLAFEYKAFDMSAFFYGVQGNDLFNFVKWWTDFSPGTFPGGRSKASLYDSWLPDGSRPNAKTPIQELNAGSTAFSNNGVVNSYYVESGSYFRMRNLQIGYTFPGSLTSKLHINKARFYIQGTNLFTATNYTGLNPEVPGTAATDKSSLTSGIDIGSYPVVREYLIGAQITF